MATVQGNAARDLATAYRRAARGVAAAPTGALAAAARDDMAAALKSTGDAWARYARAARARSVRGARSASATLDTARARIIKAQAALAVFGYTSS